MGGEDCGDIDASLLGEGQSHTSEPLVEVGNNRLALLVAHELFTVSLYFSPNG